MVKINGNDHDLAGRSVAEVLAELGYETGRIAVEKDEEIIPKSAYGQTILKDGDTIEVVSFVGGG
ncbi:MAG: sulfur carrier protein ThiS [Lachnospiraceae bacterium]|nr:sulfur carrier protein ThiS [Lachnospiraceae bacterium]